jgi:penicillin-binding protein 2
MRFLRKKRRQVEINPDEIFLDSSNIPNFDTQQFEGRLEMPISKRVFSIIGFCFGVIIFIFAYQLQILQIKKGEAYNGISERNSLNGQIIFADRGIIYDRNGLELAWNDLKEDENSFARRAYIEDGGFGLLLGYVDSPKKDRFGFWWQEEFIGMSGLEKQYNNILNGNNGNKFVEKTATGEVVSENIINEPDHGNNLNTTIDGKLQAAMYNAIYDLSHRIGYEGGAGVMMDIYTGEVLALTSYPEYSSSVMSSGEDSALIQSYLSDTRRPFLNRAISGLYSPGSTVKLFIGIGALNEGLIDENTRILSTGAVEIPNPYNPELSTIFRDWREGGHGSVSIVRAIGDSVNTFFYAIGGGLGRQSGLGISKIDHYIRLFGIGERTGIDLGGEVAGVIPNPEWKKRIFNGDAWRLGDTYNTSIGQYGFQVTPIQMARAVAAIASEGVLVKPSLLLDSVSEPQKIQEDFSSKDYQLIKDGMRDVVVGGTGQLLNVRHVEVAAKTGTAQTGQGNRFINSWSIGFFPYENPKYAFAVLMERGPSQSDLSASFAMRQVLDWINENAPEYFE